MVNITQGHNNKKDKEVEKMLEKERFLAIKKLARDIRKDNKKRFEEFEDVPVEIAIRDKNDFIESIINNMASAFSEGEQGKEEKQIFRANILIPDDDEFFDTYSKDKNIRNLMNKYSVNIEDIMSKITELNIYGKYIDESDEVVDEIVSISPKEAEDLLDEIDSLSNTLTNLDLNLKEYDDLKDETSKFKYDELKDETPKFISSKVNDKPKEEVKEEFEEPVEESFDKDDDFLGESFDNINSAISEFISDYNSLKEELKQNTKYISSLEKNVKNLTDEKSKIKSEMAKLKTETRTLKSDNSGLKNENSELKNKNSELKIENSKLNKRAKTLEEKLYKSMELLKKVYTGIRD